MQSPGKVVNFLLPFEVLESKANNHPAQEFCTFDKSQQHLKNTLEARMMTIGPLLVSGVIRLHITLEIQCFFYYGIFFLESITKSILHLFPSPPLMKKQKGIGLAFFPPSMRKQKGIGFASFQKRSFANADVKENAHSMQYFE